MSAVCVNVGPFFGTQFANTEFSTGLGRGLGNEGHPLTFH